MSVSNKMKLPLKKEVKIDNNYPIISNVYICVEENC